MGGVWFKDDSLLALDDSRVILISNVVAEGYTTKLGTGLFNPRHHVVVWVRDEIYLRDISLAIHFFWSESVRQVPSHFIQMT